MIVPGLKDVLIHTCKQTPHTNNSLFYYHLIVFMARIHITDVFVRVMSYSSYFFEYTN